MKSLLATLTYYLLQYFDVIFEVFELQNGFSQVLRPGTVLELYLQVDFQPFFVQALHIVKALALEDAGEFDELKPGRSVVKARFFYFIVEVSLNDIVPNTDWKMKENVKITIIVFIIVFRATKSATLHCIALQHCIASCRAYYHPARNIFFIVAECRKSLYLCNKVAQQNYFVVRTGKGAVTRATKSCNLLVQSKVNAARITTCTLKKKNCCDDVHQQI